MFLGSERNLFVFAAACMQRKQNILSHCRLEYLHNVCSDTQLRLECVYVAKGLESSSGLANM